jgi:hypothetical protein
MRAGRPQVGLIAGAAGIGKTRLLKEVQATAMLQGVSVLYGRCYEDVTLPYLPFVETLLAWLEQAAADIVHALSAEQAVIRQFLGRHASTAPVSSPMSAGQAEQEQLQLLVAVARATITMVQRSPSVLIVDDLHWADPPSLDLLEHLVFTVADTAVREPVPFLILGTYRPEEQVGRLARLIARLQREDICHTLTLPGLDEPEMRALIQGLGLVRPSHQLVATINAVTHGNPLFTQEVVHHLQQRKAMRERGGYLVTTASAADLQLPEQVVSVLTARIQELSEGCRQLLTLTAVLGERVSLPVLVAVSGMSEDALLDRLEEGMHEHLLLSEGNAFQFAHPLIRQACYTLPSALRRQRLHAQVAQALERLYADSLEAHILEIAHHLVRAGGVAEAHKVLQYARQAGDQAFTVFAWGDTARYYEAALAVAESTGELSAQDQAELHYRTGLAYYRDQDVGPCLDHYDKAIAAYRFAGDVRGLSQVLMQKTETQYTLASVPLGVLADVQPLQGTLTVLGDDEPGLRGRILAIMSQVYRVARQEAHAKATAQQALAIGQRLQDDQLCTRAGFALGLAHIHGLHVREALESWQSALASARRTDDLLLQGLPLQRMPLGFTLLGQFDDAEAVALEGCELTRQTADWGEYSLALSHLTCVAIARGDFEAAERHARETMLMVYRSHYPWGGFRSQSALACAYALRGAWTEAEVALATLAEPGRVFEQPGTIIPVFVRVYRQLLRAYAEAVLDEAVEQLAADLMAVVGSDTYALAPLCALIELGVLVGVPAVTESPYQVLAMAIERGVLFSSGWMFLIPRVLGRMATLHRWWDEADSYLQTAIATAVNAKARPELGRAYLDYAHLLVAKGRRSDRQRALELVNQASALLYDLGMQPFERRAAQLTAILQSSMYPGSLDKRDEEILLRMTRSRTHFLG